MLVACNSADNRFIGCESVVSILYRLLTISHSLSPIASCFSHLEVCYV